MFRFTICLFFLVVSYSCKENKNISSDLFNTDNLKIKINSVYDLDNQGFIPEKGNISILSKKNKDTIIKLEVNFDLKCLNSKIWKVKLNSNDRIDIGNFLLKYDVHLLGPSGYFNDEAYQVLAINFKTNKLFVCTVSNEEGGFYLTIKYYIPR